MKTQKTCKERATKNLKDRISDLEKLWENYVNGNDENIDDLRTPPEHGLCFDYVALNIFKNQKKGYFRYQDESSDEFRFFCDENLNLVRIEYWFWEWFDEATIILTGKALSLMTEIFEDLVKWER